MTGIKEHSLSEKKVDEIQLFRQKKEALCLFVIFHLVINIKHAL